jgi:hypothetical protein
MRTVAYVDAARAFSVALERFPTGWNNPIDRKSLFFKKLERVVIEQVYQLSKHALSPW